MKRLFFIPVIISAVLAGNSRAHGQGLFNRIKQKAQDKLNNKVDNTTDKALDKADPTSTSKKNGSSGNGSNADGSEAPVKTIASYKNYDFVPGDKIIFQSQLPDERNGEIPSQFTVTQGQVDVQTEDGEKVIHVPTGGGAIFMPRLKNSGSLPSAFTIEFDYKNEKYGAAHVNVNFGFRVNTNGPDDVMTGIGFFPSYATWTQGEIAYPQGEQTATAKPMVWHHYSIAINGDVGKAYVDQYRVNSVNNLAGKPKGIFFEMIGYEESYMKNVRIAEGGIDAYKKITTNNKIITHGILFDVDQATIRPESMGTINSIYEVLNNDPSLKFEIDGHTDNTGTAARNLALSKLRAEAVKSQLVSMGIDGSRLTAKGFGDTKPIALNTSPEGKANNRRVEFVKI